MKLVSVITNENEEVSLKNGYCYGIWTLNVCLVLKYQILNKGCPYTIVEGFRGDKHLMRYKPNVLHLHIVKELCSEFPVTAQRSCRFFLAYLSLFHMTHDIRTIIARSHESNIYE